MFYVVYHNFWIVLENPCKLNAQKRSEDAVFNIYEDSQVSSASDREVVDRVEKAVGLLKLSI